MDVKIHCNYPGGNIKVSSVDGQRIQLEQDIRDSSQWWFYWNFCVENAQGKELEFEFINGEVIGPWGPSISKDYITWEWLGNRGFHTHRSFTYSFGPEEDKVYFCFSIPYQVERLGRFLDKHSNNALLYVESLTQSEQGRDVPLLLIGNHDAKEHIVFSCRHHACESTASYQLEGVMEYLLEQKDSALLQNYLFHIIPFVDIDGVENGDQGKARAPHDHNRDYMDYPIYKSTAAIMKYCDQLNVVVGIDFHSPGLWGGRNDYPFIVKMQQPVKQAQEKFGDILKAVTSNRKDANKIVYTKSMDIEAYDEWNNVDLPMFTKYLYDKKTKLCFSFEFPYFGIGDTVYTQENCVNFGRDFAKALELFLIE